MPPPTFTNRYGRRPARGLRPWLLLPKVIAVGLYLGGLAAALVLWTMRDLANPAQRLLLLNHVGSLIEYLAIPALLAALLLGTALLFQHPRQFVRMRWLIVKLASLAILIPTAHLYCSSRVAILRDMLNAGLPADAVERQLTWGLALTLSGSLWIIILGRLKPRLGQNWAHSYAASTATTTTPPAPPSH